MDDTQGVFHAAYIIAVIVYGGYALTIWMRAKRVREKLGRVDRHIDEPADRPTR